MIKERFRSGSERGFRTPCARRNFRGWTFLLTVGSIVGFSAGGARSQTLVIEPQFEQAGHFHEGIAPVSANGLWGFIDRRGAWVVSPRYNGVLKGADGRFGILENSSWGYVDTSGKISIPPRYKDARPFGGGVAAVKQDNRWGFITAYGAIETPFMFDEIGGREGRLFTALSSNPGAAPKWSVFRAYPGGQPCDQTKPDYGDPEGVHIYSTDYDRSFDATRLYGFSEGLAVAQFEPGEARVNEEGFVLRSDPSFFAAIRRRSEGWAAAQRNEVWGYINEKNIFVSPHRLEAAREFSMGVAPVKLGGLWGYMNKVGRIVLRPQFDDAYSFYEGYANVRVGERRGFLKIAGDRISVFIEPKFEDAYRFQEGLAPVKVNGRWGYLAVAGATPAPAHRDLVDLLAE